MIADMMTVVWKEWKEIFLMRGSLRSSLLNIAIIVGLVGVFFPLQNGAEWLNSAAGLVVWSWLPLFLVMSVIADAFAGERERHTLETLLASRLSDRAILFGKITAAVLYGWSLVIASVLLGAVTVNLAHPTGQLQFYPPLIFASSLVLSLLGSLLMGSAGALVSLRSATTRQAYQKMSIAFMVIWFLPMLALQFLPAQITAGLLNRLGGLNVSQAIAGVVVFLLLVDLVLLAAAGRQFQRARLILD